MGYVRSEGKSKVSLEIDARELATRKMDVLEESADTADLAGS